MKRKQKIEILDREDPISDNEIKAYMNFDSVLNSYEHGLKNGPGNFGKILKILAVSVPVISAIIYLHIMDQPIIAPDTVNVPTPPESSEVMSNEQNNPDQNDSLVIAEPITETRSMQAAKLPHEVKNKTIDNNQISKTSNTKKSTPIPTRRTGYFKAEPKEGLTALYTYFATSLIYPKAHEVDSIEGTVVVVFTVERDSSITHVKVKKSLLPAFDSEAIRVVQHMPKWNPASLNGDPVSSKVTIPIKFEVKRQSHN